MEMTEKVVAALEICCTNAENNVCRECPYFEEEDCIDKLMEDALLVVEDQEAQIGIYESLLNGD